MPSTSWGLSRAPCGRPPRRLPSGPRWTGCHRCRTGPRAPAGGRGKYTQTGGARPFGVALLVGGVDDGEPRLFETDPSGTPYEWRATAIGGGRDEIQGYLEDNYEAEMDLDGGIGLALEGLAQPAEDGLEASGIEMTTIDVESGRVSQVPEDTIAEHIAEHGLGDENEE